MIEATEKITFEQSERVLSAQEATLDGLRARTGTLVAAAALVTAFLGGQALARSQTSQQVKGATLVHSELSGLGWAAVLCFVACLLASLYILLPRRWAFGHDAHALMDELLDRDPPAGTSELYRHLAYYNEVHRRANAKKLGVLFLVFAFGCVLLGGETILWLISL